MTSDTQPVVIADVSDQQTATTFYYPSASGINLGKYGDIFLSVGYWQNAQIAPEFSSDRVNWKRIRGWSVRYNYEVVFPIISAGPLTPGDLMRLVCPAAYMRLFVRFSATPNRMLCSAVRAKQVVRAADPYPFRLI